MNCPMHVKLFASKPRSYRDLPVRLAEFGTVYRWEQSGELNGMTRVRGFTQDDAHIFCTDTQLDEEVKGCLDLVGKVLKTFKMTDYRVRIGLRDPSSEKYVGSPEGWNQAEEACRKAARSLGVSFSEEQGEAAFYGPKIDFVVRDVLGRDWQLGTVQVDFNLPERFDLHYRGADGAEHRPVMIHRAPFGSLERFTGVLIEHFAGDFPLWLAPEQVRILPISDKIAGYAADLKQKLRDHGVRVEVDNGSEKIGAKIRLAQLAKVPYMVVIGAKEQADNTLSVRSRRHGELGVVPTDDFLARIDGEIRTREA
jgi:threonyl-tRNA synthetase